MGSKGGDTRIKRQKAPTFWKIKRKEGQFILGVRAGSHRKDRSYPLGIVLRDVLKIATTMQEAKAIVIQGNVKVDGEFITDVNRPVGLMDIVELVPSNQFYRFIPKASQILAPLPIINGDHQMKALKITSKTVIKGSKVQYGFHDGRSLISDQNFEVGDTCVLDVTDCKIKDHIKFEKGCMVLVTRGENCGIIGKVEDIRDGIFSLPKRTIISFKDRSVELPFEIVIAIGRDRTAIKVS